MVDGAVLVVTGPVVMVVAAEAAVAGVVDVDAIGDPVVGVGVVGGVIDVVPTDDGGVAPSSFEQEGVSSTKDSQTPTARHGQRDLDPRRWVGC